MEKISTASVPVRNMMVLSLKRKIEWGENAVAMLQADLARDPVNALRWAEKTMQVVAVGQVSKAILRYLEELEITLEETEKEILENVLRAGRAPTRSTSATSNAMELAMGQAWAAAYSDYRHEFESIRAEEEAAAAAAEVG